MASIEPIPIVRGMYLQKVTEVLRHHRASYETYLRQFNLPRKVPEKLNPCVPLKSFLLFTQWAAAATGLKDIGFLAGSRIKISDLDGELLDALLAAPTLECALRWYCIMGEREQAPVRYRMLRGRQDVWICSSPEASQSLAELDDCTEWLRIMCVLAVIRSFAGQDWTPSAITFRSQYELGENARRAFPRTQLLTESEITGMVFPVSLLACEKVGAQRPDPRPTTSASGRKVSEDTVWDFPASLRAVLRAYLDNGTPSVEFAAATACTSVRTLQRRLKECGLSYSDLVAQLRFQAAKDLLRDCDTKLADIAYAAGYSDPTSFSRAFRRMAGVSPQRYHALSHTVRGTVHTDERTRHDREPDLRRNLAG